MLKQFTIDNFKSLIDFRFPPSLNKESLPQFSCLVGSNGAGKSMILQAFDFIHHLASGTLDTWVKARGWKPNELTSSFSEKRTITFKLVIAEGAFSYQWSGSFNTVTSRCTTEAIHSNSSPMAAMSLSEGVLRYKRGNDRFTVSAKDFSYKGSILSFLKGDPEAMPEVFAVQKFVAGLKSLELLNPQLIKTRSREADDVGSGGEKLAGYLSHLPKDSSDEIVMELKKFYPQVTKARAQSLRAGWKTYWVTEDYKAAQKKSLETEIQHLSDGMLRILTIIAQLHSDRDCILLDEIENGLIQN